MIIINKKTVDSGSTVKTFTAHKTKLDELKKNQLSVHRG
jgi:hypothetical protein